VPVVLTDLDQARLDAGLGHVRGEIARLRERGRLSADAAVRLTALVTGSLTKDAFADAESVAALLAGGDGAYSRPSTAGEVRERALEALAEEIRLMLDEGVVAAPEDIDLCMILGAGWPFHLGGITPYLDCTGITEKVTGTRFRI
jgi:3-hydroxyacyl-CoA dehydrogenase